jgi:hypothetical protein
VGPADILGASWESVGTLLIGVGAVLVAIDTLYRPRSWGRQDYLGTYPLPAGRLAVGVAVTGVVFVAAGSLVLLLTSHGLTVLAVFVVLALAAVLVWFGMGISLWRHMHMAYYGEMIPDKPSFVWCLRHPRWVNEPVVAQDPTRPSISA